MHISDVSPRFSLCVLALAAALAAAGGAPAQAAPAAPPKPAAKTTAKPADKPAPLHLPPGVAGALHSKEAPALATSPDLLKPPDGKWLTDDKGRQYFVTPAPRVEGAYMWLNDEHTRVRLPYGLSVDLASYDDKTFYVKIYRPTETAPPPIPRRTPEELAKTAASYKFEIADSHRLAFAPFEDGLPQHGQWRNGFVVADMNGDGHLDIVHGPARKGGVRPVIFLGDGHGHWKPWATTFPPVQFDYGDVAVGDLNGDGKADLVVASHLRGITALVGDGEGNFKEWSKGIDFRVPGQGATSPAFSSRAITVIDWNRDGRPDILALGEGPLLALTRDAGAGDAFNKGARGFRVYLNQGDGSWLARDEKGNAGFGDTIATGDFNGDGLPDFAMGSNIMGYRAVVGYGKPDGSWQRINVDVVRPVAVVTALASADFDGDGRDDLAVGYSSNELGVWRSGIDILYSRPGETWERRILYNEESRNGVYSVATGDLDGDGARDLVALTGDGGAWVFAGDGKGWFSRDDSMPVVASEAGCRGYHAVLADLDGDGKDELVATFAGEGTSATGVPECSSGGAVRAWKAVKAATGAAGKR
jgi:FG-GAP-like repeat/FG-GAP repeat